MWHDPGTWIALGVSALFVGMGLIMHRVLIKVLKNGAAEPPPPLAGQIQPSASPTRTEPHE